MVDIETSSGFSSKSMRYGDLRDTIGSELIRYRRPIVIGDVFHDEETDQTRISYMVADLAPEIDVFLNQVPNNVVEIYKSIFKITFVATMSDK